MEKTIFLDENYFLTQCEVIEERKKAIKVKMTKFVAYPGTNDKTGSFIGFTWLPKKGLIKMKNSLYKLANWVKYTAN